MLPERDRVSSVLPRGAHIDPRTIGIPQGELNPDDPTPASDAMQWVRGVKAAYLDASAGVKLFRHEPESAALVEELRAWAALVSSELLAVEARCTARRLGDGIALERVEAVLAGIDLVRFTPEIRDLAGGIAFQPVLRALHTIHIATAGEARRSGPSGA